MNTEKMTVTQALVELKTLDKRIVKIIEESGFISIYQPNISQFKVYDRETEIKASFAKVKDLMARRDALKAALVKSNAVTNVQVGGKTYTVAEAIDAKQHAMTFRMRLLSRMADQLKASTDNFNRISFNVEKAAADIATKVAGGSSSEQAGSEIYKSTYEGYISANKPSMVDPLNLTETITKMSDEADEFMTNVDTALSVVNATTIIEFSYGE